MQYHVNDNESSRPQLSQKPTLDINVEPQSDFNNNNKNNNDNNINNNRGYPTMLNPKQSGEPKPETSQWCRTPDSHQKLPDLEDQHSPNQDLDPGPEEDSVVSRRGCQFCCCSRATMVIIVFFIIVVTAAVVAGGVAGSQAWRR